MRKLSILSAQSRESGDPGVFGMVRTGWRFPKKAWVPAFAGMSGFWITSPALAHEDHEHGIPGALHDFSTEHLIGPLAVALAFAIVFSLRKPLARVIARWRSRR